MRRVGPGGWFRSQMEVGGSEKRGVERGGKWLEMSLVHVDMVSHFACLEQLCEGGSVYILKSVHFNYFPPKLGNDTFILLQACV